MGSPVLKLEVSVKTAVFLTGVDSPFRLIGSLASLRELSGGGSETLLGPFKVFLQQLDASVESSNFGLSLGIENTWLLYTMSIKITKDQWQKNTILEL